MNIWELECSAKAPWTTSDEWDNELNRSLCGVARGDSWVSFELFDIPEVKGDPGYDVAYFYGGLYIVVNTKTKNLLSGFLGQNIEFLPVLYRGEQYWFLNVLCMLDCLDYERAACNFFSSGRLMWVDEYAFVLEAVKGHDIFRIRDLPQAGPFVSDALKQFIEENDIVGFSFSHAWSVDDLPETNRKDHRVMDERESIFDYVGELSQDVVDEMQEASARAAQLVKATPDASGREIAERIHDLVDALLGQDDGGDASWISAAAVGLGCLYGDAVCKEHGWKWMAFGPDDERAAFGVVSPEGNYCLAPMSFILKIMNGENIGPDGQNDNTVALLFGMLDGIDGRPGEKMMIPLG